MSEFKVGDKVRFIKAISSNGVYCSGEAYSSFNLRINNSYEVCAVSEKSTIYQVQITLKGNSVWLMKEELELVESKPAPKLKIRPEQKFSVGDRVKINWGKSPYINCYNTNYGEIKGFQSEERVNIEFKNPYTQLGFNLEWLELVEEECLKCEPRKDRWMGISYEETLEINEPNKIKEYLDNAYKLIDNEQTTSSENKCGNIMSKLTTFVKNSLLSADEKLLRKYGLKDECGEYTDEARVIVRDKILKENEAYLVEVVTAMEAEEKKNK